MHSTSLLKSSFYYHHGRPDPDAQDKVAVAEVYACHKVRYGYRRIAAALSWNKKRVARLMKLLQLKAKVRPKKAYRHPAMGETSANILNRRFEAEKPNEKWLTDATEFKCSNDKLYLSPILNVFNRKIVAYSMSLRPNSEMVERMLNDAVGKLTKADKVLLHSDQGVPYRTEACRCTLAEHGIVQSMLRKGNCWDNAPMESFFAILKTECFYQESKLSIKELMQTIDDYIWYYSNERCSLKLKKLSPVAYRTQLEKTA
ncbi:IS3 family transposase [Neisseria sp. MVDL18-041461]|nr:MULTISPECIES: IS3 family transposase [unclassified Neisseria]MDO1510153.1 IS3 family transposase [Neisseria sp. MVDL19-042950]MDO1516729.1 IS3 family transposase [Neisseria sp. MVDL18-041461]MDO1563876.1 IS3 family transposase [Neisseria sp. MVDL20-010259]